MGEGRGSADPSSDGRGSAGEGYEFLGVACFVGVEVDDVVARNRGAGARGVLAVVLMLHGAGIGFVGS